MRMVHPCCLSRISIQPPPFSSRETSCNGGG